LHTVLTYLNHFLRLYTNPNKRYKLVFRHVYKMTSRSLPSEDGFPGHVHDREDLGYDRHLQQLPKLWSSPNYIASSKPNRNIFIERSVDEDGVISSKVIPCPEDALDNQ